MNKNPDFSLDARLMLKTVQRLILEIRPVFLEKVEVENREMSMLN